MSDLYRTKKKQAQQPLPSGSVHSATVSSTDGDVTPRMGGRMHPSGGLVAQFSTMTTAAAAPMVRHVSPTNSVRPYGRGSSEEDDNDPVLDLSDPDANEGDHVFVANGGSASALLPTVPVLTVQMDDDNGDDDEDDDDDEDYELEDVIEAVEYVLNQEHVVRDGILLQEQVDKLMTLGLKPMTAIMKHFERCDNDGTGIRWEVIGDIISAGASPDEDDDDDYDRMGRAVPVRAADEVRKSQLKNLQQAALDALLWQLRRKEGEERSKAMTDDTESGSFVEEVIEEDAYIVEEEVLDDVDVIVEVDDEKEEDDEDLVDETVKEGADYMDEGQVEDEDEWVEEAFDENEEFEDDDTFDSGRSFLADDASEGTGFTIEAKSLWCNSSVTFDDNIDDISDDENDNNDMEMSVSIHEPNLRKRVEDGRNQKEISDDDTLSRSSKKRRSATPSRNRNQNTEAATSSRQGRAGRSPVTPRGQAAGRSGSVSGSQKGTPSSHTATPSSRGRKSLAPENSADLRRFLDSNRKETKQEMLRARSRSRKAGSRPSSGASVDGRRKRSVNPVSQTGRDAAAVHNSKAARTKKPNPVEESNQATARVKFQRRSSLQGDMVLTPTSATKVSIHVTSAALQKAMKQRTTSARDLRLQLRASKQISMTDLSRPKLWSSLELKDVCPSHANHKKR